MNLAFKHRTEDDRYVQQKRPKILQKEISVQKTKFHCIYLQI